MDLPGALASSIPAVVAVPALLPDWLNAETLMSNLGTFAFWAALAIIFAECGLFVFFMPGDSLLFVVGMFIATGAIDMSIWVACLLLFMAAAIGVTTRRLRGLEDEWAREHHPGRRTDFSEFNNPEHDWNRPDDRP